MAWGTSAGEHFLASNPVTGSTAPLVTFNNIVGKLVPTGYDAYAGKGTVALPALSDSGLAWLKYNNGTSGAGLTIVSNKLTNTAVAATAAAGYAELTLPSTVYRIGADIVFGAGTATSSIAMAVWATEFGLSYPATIPNAGIHWAITPTGWAFGVWVSNVFTQLTSYIFTTPLTQDGVTAYRFEVNVVGSTAYITNSDGSTTSVTDSRISQWAGVFASWEVFQNNAATESRPAMTNVWADIGQADRRAYATPGDVVSALEANRLQRLWLGVGDLSQWTGQTSATLAAASGLLQAWSFANAADNYLQVNLNLPLTWTAIKITYRWSNNGAGAGNVRWSYMLASIAPGSNVNAGPVDHPTVVAASAQNILVDTVMASTQPVVSGALTELRIVREASQGTDTLANAATLFGVLIERANG